MGSPLLHLPHRSCVSAAPSSGRAGAAGAEHRSLLLPQVLSGPSAGARSCGPQEHAMPGCPPGEEPTGVRRALRQPTHPSGSSHRSPTFPSLQACGSTRGPMGTCRACPPGTFSPGDASCSAHTRCRAGNRILMAPGTAVTDSRCGACLPG